MTRRKWPFMLLMLPAAMMLLGACTDNQTDTTQPTKMLTGQTEQLKVFFIDVGKGDASLIGLPDGHWVMIDTGPAQGFPELGRTLINQGVTHLDAVFISHGHKDHIGGLENVLKTVECDTIYTIPDCLDDQEILNAEKDYAAHVKVLAADQTVKIGDAVLTCLGPITDYGDENENSMVLMLDFMGTRLLYTADQLAAAENGLLNKGVDLKADVLKVAYHGGAESTSDEFVKAVSPKFAVVPTDETRPAPQSTLDKLSRAGARTFVLADTGTLVFDGKSMEQMPAPEAELSDVVVSDKDVDAESVTVTNRTAQTVDMTGWCLYSEKGADTYFFPAGTVLPPKASLTVYSGKAAQNSPDGLVWTTKKIWSNKKEDICRLFDAYGRQVGSF